ncbi:hypothetical protein K2P47_02420 [Patescibacteria group bacterium]|nr:hypothetical protein [Patescibacteria group bacterium]
MLGEIIKPFIPEKMILVAVCEGDQLYIFDRQQFAGLIGNKASRPWGTSPRSRGQKLVRKVAESGNRHFAVQRSAALAESVHFVFWFPKPGTFKPDEWVGKVVSLPDETVVPKAKLRVIETALVRARENLTLENWQKIA